jgi:phosphomannomutase
MLSASHNPFEDNGIKLFSADGYKLPDSVEDEIERLAFGTDLVPHMARRARAPAALELAAVGLVGRSLLSRRRPCVGVNGGLL